MWKSWTIPKYGFTTRLRFSNGIVAGSAACVYYRTRQQMGMCAIRLNAFSQKHRTGRLLKGRMTNDECLAAIRHDGRWYPLAHKRGWHPRLQ